MSTDLAVRPQQSVALSNDQLQYIAGTQFVKADIRGNLPAILATVAYGRAIGLPDMVALTHVVMIDGKPTLEAVAMNALARQRGHSIQGESGDGVATVRGRRADNGDEITVTWTLAMAERAGLLSKQNWRRYPDAMLWARAVAQLCRELFADVFAGATYTPEELGEDSAGGPEPSSGAAADTASAPHGVADFLPVSQAEPPRLPAEPASPAEEVLGPPAPPDPGVNPTQKQITYLNLTVGPMNQATKRRVWATVALMRVRDTDALILELGGVDGDGVLHWSPLRDTLTKQEAGRLIDKLEALEKQRQAEAAA